MATISNGEHGRQAHELGQETRRALTLRERMEHELDELERSLTRMRATIRELPPDPHPGPHEPMDLMDEGEPR